MFEELKKSLSEIKMSDEAKEKIIENCYSKMQKGVEHTMKNNAIKFRKRLIIAAVIMAVCVVSAGAVISHVRGFRDIVKDGAVVGTQFDEDTDMIDINADVDGDTLLVSVSVTDYNNPPYCYTEELGIGNYIIVDRNGNIPQKNPCGIKSKNGFAEGIAEYEIPIDMLPSGEYTIVINDFVSSKKADQPLHIDGKWACEFSK